MHRVTLHGRWFKSRADFAKALGLPYWKVQEAFKKKLRPWQIAALGDREVMPRWMVEEIERREERKRR